MSEGYFFTLPSSEVKRMVSISAILFGLGSLIFGDASIFIFVAIAHLVSYFCLLHHKFVFVSAEGIRGEGPTGRNTLFAWSEPVKLKVHLKFGIPGYAIASLDAKLLVNSVFIPKAILRDHRFKSIVTKWAPSNHVLLQP